MRRKVKQELRTLARFDEARNGIILRHRTKIVKIQNPSITKFREVLSNNVAFLLPLRESDSSMGIIRISLTHTAYCETENLRMVSMIYNTSTNTVRGFSVHVASSVFGLKNKNIIVK